MKATSPAESVVSRVGRDGFADLGLLATRRRRGQGLLQRGAPADRPGLIHLSRERAGFDKEEAARGIVTAKRRQRPARY